MLLESVRYTRPESLDEALRALTSEEGAAALAGGQSLVNVLKNRVASVDLLVDITRLKELHGISATADGGLEIGAGVTYDELDRSPEVRASHELLAEVAGHIEDQQIRNRGTIGGNCCLSDPTNNLPPVVMALGGVMNLVSGSGERQVPSDEFFHGYFMTAVEQGELLRSITLPPLGPNAGAGHSSLNVGGDSKAIVRAAAWVRGNGTVEDARVVLAAIGPKPIRHPGMEERLKGGPATADAVNAASEVVGVDDGLEPVTDSHGTADYRRRMARVMARRAVHEAMLKGGNGR